MYWMNLDLMRENIASFPGLSLWDPHGDSGRRRFRRHR